MLVTIEQGADFSDYQAIKLLQVGITFVRLFSAPVTSGIGLGIHL